MAIDFPEEPLTSEVGNVFATIHIDSPLSKRELFAAMAMQGMLQAGEEVYPQIFDSVARDSLMFADALIEALKDE